MGDNVADTMGKVKRELGSEAVILQTREVREGGFLGLFGKMRVEITAAIDDKPLPDQKAQKAQESSYGHYVASTAGARGKTENGIHAGRGMSPEPVFDPGPLSEPLPKSGSESKRDFDYQAIYEGKRNADYDAGQYVDRYMERGAADQQSEQEAELNVNRSIQIARRPETTAGADANANVDVSQDAGVPYQQGQGADQSDQPEEEEPLKRHPYLNAYRQSGGSEESSPPPTNREESSLLSKGAGGNSSLAAEPKPGIQGIAGNMQAEITMMRKMLERMTQKMEGTGEEIRAWPLALQKWVDYLESRGINQNMVQLLMNHVQQTLTPEEWQDDVKVYARLEGNVRQICGQIGMIKPGIDKPRVVALIGATGVGKTTTIGKLAAGFSIIDKRKVALITVDTYRVAAVEQLKTFGEIIGVPVKVVMTPVGLREAIEGYGDKELIFIDTAGRSPYHDLHMSELEAFLEQAKPDFTMLVLSATTQFSDQLKGYRRFEPLTTHLIFTKLDETESAGSILNLLGQTTLPTAYLANGQNVPDDIEAATPHRIARYVLGEETPHA